MEFQHQHLTDCSSLQSSYGAHTLQLKNEPGAEPLSDNKQMLLITLRNTSLDKVQEEKQEHSSTLEDDMKFGSWPPFTESDEICKEEPFISYDEVLLDE